MQEASSVSDLPSRSFCLMDDKTLPSDWSLRYLRWHSRSYLAAPSLIEGKRMIVQVELTIAHKDVTVLIFFPLCEINTKLQSQHDASSNYLQGNTKFAYCFMMCVCFRTPNIS